MVKIAINDFVIDAKGESRAEFLAVHQGRQRDFSRRRSGIVICIGEKGGIPTGVNEKDWRRGIGCNRAVVKEGLAEGGGGRHLEKLGAIGGI
jgi:hypothetical protein